MLDWLASMAVVRRSERRIELAVTASTRWAGWSIALVAAVMTAMAWTAMPMLSALPAVLIALGLLLATTRRRLVFDRDEGLLRVEQRILGARSRMTIPLFHLRAVVIAAEGAHYVTYLERRAGGHIRIDDSRDLVQMMALGRAICEVTQLRLVTGAPRNSSAG